MDSATLTTGHHSIGSLLDERATSQANATYLLEARGARSRSFAELRDEVASLRARLQAWGVRPGDRVGLLLEDPLTFSSWFIAGLTSGVWVAPLDPTVKPTNLGLVVERALTLSLSAIVSDREAPDQSALAWYEIGADSSRSLSGELPNGSDTGGVILSSSGTTGTPKVVALSTGQLLETASLIARHNRLTREDRGFNPLPLWHVNAEVVALLATLVAGASLVLDDSFHRTGFWKVIDDFEVTWINAVPAIIARLSVVQGDEVPLERVRFVRSASAPLSPVLLAKFEALTGVPVIQSYGMTEAASQICVNPLDGPRKPGSVGVAVGVAVRVVPAEHDPAPDEATLGYIEIKGPTVIRAYESAAYDDRFDDEGWLRTGDLGYFDEDDYLFIVGRSDDVINRGGEKIYPLEIENVLVNLDGVGIVAVVGEPDEVFGHVPVAYVQPSDLAVLDAPEACRTLVQSVRARVLDAFAKSHRPSYVKLVHHFPSHATGKIRKDLLREGGVIVVYEERL